MVRSFLLLLLAAVTGLAVLAQSPKPAEKGITYGTGTTTEGAIDVNALETNVKNNQFEGKIRGKVTEVCQEKGCWMKLDKSDGGKLMVKFKDYGFFMPKDIIGREVVLEGVASVNEVSVKQQKHYAEDAGKSKDEIAKIKHPKKEMHFIAKGVLVL